MNLKKLAALLLALAMIFTLAACGNPAADATEAPTDAPTEPAEETEEPSEAPTEAPTEEPSAAPTEDIHVERPVPRLAVLSGPTGIGAAKLLSVPEENAHTPSRRTTPPWWPASPARSPSTTSPPWPPIWR